MEKRVKLIKEKLLLSACQKDDLVRIYHREKGRHFSIGETVLRKIKPIGKGKVQIKYSDKLEDTIQKADLPGNLEVERIRAWVESDGEDAGYYERRQVIHEGIPYIEIEPSPRLTKEQFAADHLIARLEQSLDMINPGMGSLLSAIFGDPVDAGSFSHPFWNHSGMMDSKGPPLPDMFPMKLTIGADVFSEDVELIKPTYIAGFLEGHLPNGNSDRSMPKVSVQSLLPSPKSDSSPPSHSMKGITNV